MEIAKLRYFYEVAKFQHVTRAAENIHIAQPALTQAIKSLEKELGVPLFYKQGRNIFLTEYGKYLKGKLDHIIPDIESIPVEIGKMKNTEEKVVRLNIIAASVVVINAILEYKKIEPDVIFTFTQNKDDTGWDIMTSTDSVSKTYDYGDKFRTSIREDILLSVPIDSKLSQKDEIALEEVKDENFVVLSGFKKFRAICDKYCRQAGFETKIIFESDTFVAVQNIIGAGLGIGFWPAFSWGSPHTNKVKLLKINKPHCQRELIIELANKEPILPYAVEFYKFLTEYITNLSKQYK